MFERRYSYGEVEWGTTLCAARCGRTAVLLYEGEPLCADDCERLVERQQLLALYPEIAERLPPVFFADQR